MRLKKVLPDLLFVLFLTVSSFFYGYFTTLDNPPEGVHVWRQADGASMANHFYEHDNSILEPQMNNQQGNMGKAAGEFPIMYYIVSIGYHLFGFDYSIYRIIWLLTTYVGLFFLYKLSSKLLNNSYYGGYVAAFLFTSPVYVIYGISFITDSIALSISFIGFYFIYQYSQQRGIRNLLLSIFFIALAALLKITTLIPTLALLGTLCISDVISFLRKEKQYLLHLKSLIGFISVFGILFFWYKYADWYNLENETEYFFLRSAPIWSASAELIEEVRQAIMVWRSTYLFQSGRHFILVLMGLVLIPVFYKRLSFFFYVFYVIALIGIVGFFLMFYSQFMYHDYYAIALMIVIPLTILMFIKKYSWLIEKNMGSMVLISGAFLVFLVLSVINTKRKTDWRFNPNTEWLNNLYELESQLTDYGIDENSLLVAPDDASPNVVLNALKRNGWSANNFADQQKVLETKILQGAKFLVITDTNFYENPLIDPYRNNLIVDYKGIRIYSLISD